MDGLYGWRQKGGDRGKDNVSEGREGKIRFKKVVLGGERKGKYYWMEEKTRCVPDSEFNYPAGYRMGRIV